MASALAGCPASRISFIVSCALLASLWSNGALIHPQCDGGSHCLLPKSGGVLPVAAEKDDAAPATQEGEQPEATEAEPANALREVNGDELYGIIRQNDFVLVEFFAPWCGHCKNLLPELQKAAKMVKLAGLKTQMLQVDATKELVAAKEFEVQGYPTFKFFRNRSTENPTTPEFGRTADSILDWVMLQEKGPVEELTSEALKSFIHDHRAKDKTISVVAYAVRKTKRVKLYEDFARENKKDRVKFYTHYVTDKDTVKVDFYRWSQAFKIKNEKEILTYKGRANGGWTKTDLVQHLKKAQERLLLEGIGFSPFQNPSDPMTLLWVITDKKDDDLQVYVDELLPLAEKKKELVLFSIIPYPPMGDDTNILLEAGIALSEPKEKAVLVEMESWETKRMPNKYMRDDIQSVDDIRLFLKDYSQKLLTPFRKSQRPVPEQEGDVVPLVADTFESIALDPKKHTFVMYMAPWCGHCKQLKPIWAEFAQEVGRSKQYKNKVLIAIMDATANDLHDHGAVSGYPSLVIYPAGTKQISGHVVYSGQRTKEELWNFLEDVADVSDDEL